MVQLHCKKSFFGGGGGRCVRLMVSKMTDTIGNKVTCETVCPSEPI